MKKSTGDAEKFTYRASGSARKIGAVGWQNEYESGGPGGQESGERFGRARPCAAATGRRNDA